LCYVLIVTGKRRKGLEMPEINIILGPPGTGKTENLLRIMDRELKEKTADPGEIAFVTFTTRAANEASQRAQEKFNLTEDDLPYQHSSCVWKTATRNE